MRRWKIDASSGVVPPSQSTNRSIAVAHGSRAHCAGGGRGGDAGLVEMEVRRRGGNVIEVRKATSASATARSV
jgi:hypothetical protein